MDSSRSQALTFPRRRDPHFEDMRYGKLDPGCDEAPHHIDLHHVSNLSIASVGEHTLDSNPSKVKCYAGSEIETKIS